VNRDHRFIRNLIRRSSTPPFAIGRLGMDGFEADKPWYGGWGAIWHGGLKGMGLETNGNSACLVAARRDRGMVWCFVTRFFIVGQHPNERMEWDHPLLRHYSIHDQGVEDFVMGISSHLSWPKPSRAIA
jgi:hypothetical protein